MSLRTRGEGDVQRVNSLGIAAGISVAAATVIYLIMIASQGGVRPSDVGGVAAWATGFSVTALAVVALSTARVAPPLRTFGLGVLSWLLAIAGAVSVFSMGAPLLLGAALAAIASVRSTEPGTGARYVAVAFATFVVAIGTVALIGFALSFLI